MRLNRIIIIGNCGSGKTYLAGALASSFDIPVINLDNIYFISGTVFQKRSANEIVVAIRKIQNKKKWVVEGVYGDLA